MKQTLHRLFSQRPFTGWAILLLLLAFLQYGNTLGHDYAWDDAIVIVQNERVQKGISAIPSHFEFRTRSQFSDFSGFRPVTMSSFSIDQSIAPMNPMFGHLMNVLLFGLLCIVLFYTLLHLFPNFHPAFSFLVSLLFLVHPLHVEVVANIKSRDEILALLFGLLALQAFVRHYQQGKWGWLALSTFCLLLSIWSKETGYFMIPVLGLAVVAVLPGNWKRKGIGLLKLTGQVACLFLITWLVTRSAPGSVTEVSANVFQENLLMGNSLAVMDPEINTFGNEARLFVLYLKSFFLPHPLVYYSGYAQIPVYAWPAMPLLLSLGMLLLFIGGATWALLRYSWSELAFGAWFFLLTLAFFLQPFGNYLADAKADRFMFMPSVGLCLLVVGLLFRLLKLDREAGPLEWLAQKGRGYAVAGVLGLAVLLFSAKTFSRNAAWKDNLTLFSTDMPYLENCAKAHYYYANALREQAGNVPDAKLTQEIIVHYRRAVEITPMAYFSYVELGQMRNGMGDFVAAEAAMLAAVAAHPNEPEVHFLLGRAQFGLRKFAAALQNLEMAWQADQGPDETWEFLGRALGQVGNPGRAVDLLRTAIARNPANLYLRDALSDVYFDSGQVEASFPPLMEILKMDGSNPIWWKKVIGRYQLVGNAELASQYYQQAKQRGILE